MLLSLASCTVDAAEFTTPAEPTELSEGAASTTAEPTLTPPARDEVPGLLAGSELPLANAAAGGTPVEIRVAPGTAIATLDDVEQAIAALTPAPPLVHVLFARGSFHRSTATKRWRHYAVGQTIRFMPEGWTGFQNGTAEAIAASCPRDDEKPTFSGFQTAGTDAGFALRGTWFYALPRLEASIPLGLEFYCLHVTSFTVGGIAIAPTLPTGASEPYATSASITGVRIIGNLFSNLGSRWSKPENDTLPDNCGYGGVTLRHTEGAVVAGNRFVNLVDRDSTKVDCKPGTMHAIYMKFDANNGKIVSNSATRVSGDPFRVAYSCDGNLLANNRLVRSGADALVSDYMQPADRGKAWSTGNRIERYARDNRGFFGNPLPLTYCYDGAPCPSLGGTRFVVSAP